MRFFFKGGVFIFILCTASCLALRAQDNFHNFSSQSIQSSKYWLDLDFVGDGIIGHRLDVHLPQIGTGPFPVVVVIYGSAWFSNSSKANTFKEGLGQVLLENGYAVVSINHRSSKDALFPAQIHDVKAAIRFIRGNAAQFNLDTAFVAITGWSSGGHLAAMAGATSGLVESVVDGVAIDLEGHLGSFREFASDVDAVVDWFGPTDFLIMDACGSSFSHNEAKSPESSLVGGPIQQNQQACALANPVNYVHPKVPPFMIIHGDEDPLVPLCQSERMQEALKQQEIRSTFMVVKGGGHGPLVMIKQYYIRMIDFLREVQEK